MPTSNVGDEFPSHSMNAVVSAAVPVGTLLGSYAADGVFTDAYLITLDREVSLPEFIAAFYTTPLFRLERWLIARALHLPSTDQEAYQLAIGNVDKFSAWHVESRGQDQALLAAGRTRSWLMVSPAAGHGTKLYFGSAVVPRKRGGLGWQFTALLGFHKAYSRLLLAAAAQRVSTTHGRSIA